MRTSLSANSLLFSNSAQDWIDRRKFALGGDSSTYCERREFALAIAGTAFVDFAELTARRLASSDAEAIVVYHEPGDYVIEVRSGTLRGLVQIVTGGQGFASQEGRYNFTTFATGPRDFVVGFFEALRERYGEARLATVT